MKLLISTYDSIKNPYYGGGGAVVMNKVSSVLSKNNDVIVITGSYPGVQSSRIINGVKYKFISTSIFGPKIGQLIYSVILPFYVLIEKHDIWIESFTPPFTTSFLPIFTKKPVIGVTHFLDAEQKSKQYKLPFTWIERLGIRQYKYIIALTENQKEKILKINKSCNVKVISNATDLVPIKKISKSKENYVLFMGRLEIAQKGLDLLIPAFSNVVKKCKTMLYIAGTGSEQDTEIIKKLVKKYDLESNVKLLGYVKGKNKQQLLSNAICLLMPSRFEGQSLTAIESIVSATPIICFDIDGLKWLSNKVSIKTKPFDEFKLGHNIVEIIKNKKLRDVLKRNCMGISSQFSWDTVTEQYSSYLQFVKGN